MRGAGIRLGGSLLPLAVGVAVVLVGSPVGLRAAFLVLAPAVAVLVPRTGTDLLARLLLAIAVVVVIDGLVSEVMLAAQIWSPANGTLAVGAASTVVWAVLAGADLLRLRGRKEEGSDPTGPTRPEQVATP